MRIWLLRKILTALILGCMDNKYAFWIGYLIGSIVMGLSWFCTLI